LAKPLLKNSYGQYLNYLLTHEFWWKS
jgi:hypothetical protein